ncbi:hypothetical protein ACHQM5_018229 [Ranunculus cassubicifolius]
MASFLDQENFDGDKLTQEIFSLLENKFLFGSANPKNSSPTRKSDVSNENIFKNIPKSDVGKVRILSIDGCGATDGFLAAKALVHLESSLCKKSGNPDARISDFFDVGTGSGVGGILIALLFTKGEEDNGRAMFKANEALQFIIKNRGKLIPSSSTKKGLFSGLFKSSSSKGHKIFRKMFGDATLRDTLKPVLIPCYDLSTRAPFLFSRTDAMENDEFDFKLREVCSATSADPMVKAFDMSSIDKKTRILAVDGGVAMNNPTAAAITHVLNNKQEFPFCNSVEDLLVVSLGNGVSDSSATPNFVKIGGEASSDIIDESVSKAFDGCSTSIGSKNKLVDIAEKMLTQKNVESVLFRGKKVSEVTNLDKLEIFAGELLKEHQRRKISVLPTVMLKTSATPRSSSATSYWTSSPSPYQS